MTTLPADEVLLANLDRVVQDTLAYFEGPGRTTDARVDQWQARDVLMHFIYFHDATALGYPVGSAGRTAVAGAGRFRHRERGMWPSPSA